MTIYYAFNGDADGLCGLQQLRLDDPRDGSLITGVKRDIKLLHRVDAVAGDEVTVLDISLDQNRDDLIRVLDGGASVRYFDHHHAGTMPEHPRFAPYILESPDVCTSMLVDRHLGGRHRLWAIVGAFGDSLSRQGLAMSREQGLDGPTSDLLERLGVALNYNAYGDTISDLCFHPAELAHRMRPFSDPIEFVHSSPVYEELRARYEDDMRMARALKPARQVPGASMVVLPDEAWARRAIGVLANELMHAQPDYALAILSPKVAGHFTVSIRVPAQSPVAADEFCRGFATGGGRKRAGGINDLPATELDRFANAFETRFRTP